MRKGVFKRLISFVQKKRLSIYNISLHLIICQVQFKHKYIPFRVNKILPIFQRNFKNITEAISEFARNSLNFGFIQRKDHESGKLLNNRFSTNLNVNSKEKKKITLKLFRHVQVASLCNEPFIPVIPKSVDESPFQTFLRNNGAHGGEARNFKRSETKRWFIVVREM